MGDTNMINRRKFLKLGAASTAPLLPLGTARGATSETLEHGGIAYSRYSGEELEGVSSICGQCPSHCAIVGYLDRDRLYKIEGQPSSIRNEGKICAKGQAGAQKLYDPDRILHPMRRTGQRGEGKWEKISWDTALEDLTGRLQKLRDDGEAGKFVFHHGWISDSAEQLIDETFLPAYGTKSIIRQTCRGQSPRWTAQELTWGGHEDNWDFERARYILNFGSNVLEAHTNHVSLARRLSRARVEHRLRMVTFDVRLSNTAAKSDQWLPIKPGTDLAVVLGMCNVIMAEGLYAGSGEDFLKFCLVNEDRNASAEEKIEILNAHLEPYTPEWAEGISGVSASQITDIAREFANAGPACVISSRGASARYNGVETERAIQMLAAITGNIDNPGGRCRAVEPQWNYPVGLEDIPEPDGLAFIDSSNADAVLTGFDAGHKVLSSIQSGGERPGVYMWYHHNPAYSSSNTQQTIEILKDESLLPFTVAVTPFYDETAALADLILPDALDLERFEIETGASPDQIAEYAIRQPILPPQGEARDFQDVCCDLAERMGFPLGFDSAEKFVEKACKLTPIVKKKARGFRRMKQNGVWHDKDADPIYYAYREIVSTEALAEPGVIFDSQSGTYWNWKVAGIESEEKALQAGYADTPNASKAYVGQEFDNSVYAGFAPGRLNKSGYFELYSPILAAHSQPGLPTYVGIPEHQAMQDDELILTTFKVNVQTLSSTANSSWLGEITHENPAWLNPLTAGERNISDGDSIKVSSQIGRVDAIAHVTATIAPGVIAIPAHSGHQQGGRYAAGKPSPFSIEDARHDEHIWWQVGGTHSNRIIAQDSEPVSGQQRWMDTVVSVVKV